MCRSKCWWRLTLFFVLFYFSSSFNIVPSFGCYWCRQWCCCVYSILYSYVLWCFFGNNFSCTLLPFSTQHTRARKNKCKFLCVESLKYVNSYFLVKIRQKYICVLNNFEYANNRWLLILMRGESATEWFKLRKNSVQFV